jgi:aspartyl aminopeptidase
MQAPSETAFSLLRFIDASPTPFHAVETMGQRLADAGFRRLEEQDVWNLKPNGRYWLVRGGTSVIAWIQGEHPAAESGFRVFGAHTDSPNLHVKPCADVSQYGYRQLGVEVYGGVLLSSWTDRDLSLAGSVHFLDASGNLTSQLLRIDRPLLRIPLLAIHLNRNVNEKGLALNAQAHLPPILGLQGEATEEGALKALISQELGIAPAQLLSYDLSLFDTQPGAVLGEQGEFLVAPRLDNLCSCFCGLEALLSQNQASPSTRVLACFDHEEIGSETMQGAASSLLKHTLRRISQASEAEQGYERAVARSLFLSADMAHAVHPNYPDRHDPQHFPQMNSGPVIKINAQGRYATHGATEALFEKVCRDNDLPVQKFINRTDLACGSTIGPMLSADLGIPTVDVGIAQLSMHSIREMCGSADPDHMVRASTAFLGLS